MIKIFTAMFHCIALHDLKISGALKYVSGLMSEQVMSIPKLRDPIHVNLDVQVVCLLFIDFIGEICCIIWSCPLYVNEQIISSV